jgi:hypothetical protein
MLKNCTPFTYATFKEVATPLLGKRVMLTTIRGAKYSGVIFQIAKKKLRLDHAMGHYKNEACVKFSPKNGLTRDFNYDSLAYLKEVPDPPEDMIAPPKP